MAHYTNFRKIPILQYDMISADPAWDYVLRSEAGKGKSPNQHYDCMDLNDIKAMRPANIATWDCVLLMWCPAPFLPHALDVLDCWGFEFKTAGFWHKKTKHGKDGFGTGFRLRSTGEPFLLATNGNPKASTNTRNVIESCHLFPDVIEAKLREHSRKPDQVFDYLKTIFPTHKKCIELFARQPRDGWDSWGDEINKFDEEKA